MDTHSILLMDPFKNLLNAYRMILEEENYVVETAANMNEAQSLFKKKPFSAVIMEYLPPHERIAEMVRWMKATSPEIYILIVANAAVNEVHYENLFEIGVDDFLLKPYLPGKIIAHVKKGLRQREMAFKIKEMERLNLLHPVSKDVEGFIFNQNFLGCCLRQEMKRARRHHRLFSILLIQIPGEDKIEEPLDYFYRELSRMVRKFIREEDVVVKDNGDVVLLLPETDQMGSQALGRRLYQIIQNHPSFQHDDTLYTTAQTLSFQYFTFPDRFDLPEPLKGVIEEMGKRNSPH